MRLYFAPKPTIACETLGIYYRLMLHPSKIESAFRMPILSKSSRTLFFNKFLVLNRAFSLEQLRLKSLKATSGWHKQVLAPKSSIPGTSSQLSLSIAWKCDDALMRTQLEQSLKMHTTSSRCDCILRLSPRLRVKLWVSIIDSCCTLRKSNPLSACRS